MCPPQQLCCRRACRVHRGRRDASSHVYTHRFIACSDASVRSDERRCDNRRPLDRVGRPPAIARATVSGTTADVMMTSHTRPVVSPSYLHTRRISHKSDRWEHRLLRHDRHAEPSGRPESLTAGHGRIAVFGPNDRHGGSPIATATSRRIRVKDANVADRRVLRVTATFNDSDSDVAERQEGLPRRRFYVADAALGLMNWR
jgi:hypothetical protein